MLAHQATSTLKNPAHRVCLRPGRVLPLQGGRDTRTSILLNYRNVTIGLRYTPRSTTKNPTNVELLIKINQRDIHII
ncbi:hypothetical protein SAMN05216387_102322 [Nitrosovibrio tenuis]|uniref:Uncharacterized protein n=1 Tax=Nitrosovibrio tenuis TaxID=1233 RepID=A0A1H7IWI3_9PROT|nr:hypothetical protein SAMN05216387_102322 [Nitrosovibrio tenuis]